MINTLIWEGAFVMKQKTNNGERLGFRTYYGTTTMGATEALTSSLMSSFFMMYLTDYSGLGSWAASLGSALLVFARFFDAINDPFEAWIMDRAKPGKFGKYRPFVFLSIIMQTIGVACLFFIPTFESKIAVAIWVIVFYLIYDIGYSFFSPEVMYRSAALDDGKRAKLMIAPRILTMFLGMAVSSLVSIVAAVNVHFNNYHTAFGVTVLVFLALAAVLALSGISVFKERHIVERDKEEVVKITDAIDVLKRNDALRNRLCAGVFAGFIYTCVFATTNYYIKWGFCADLATGAVDTAQYGIFLLISSMMMFLPILLGTAISIPLMNKLGSPIRMLRFVIGAEAACCGLIAILHFTGLLTPIPFFISLALCATALGTEFVPAGALAMESMDYEVYKNGRDRAATINTLGKLLGKAQSAFATAAVGATLTAVGYVVDSATDTYLGDLAAMPSLLNWFIIILAVIPCVFGGIALLIMRKYPVTDEVRADMKKALGKE